MHLLICTKNYCSNTPLSVLSKALCLNSSYFSISACAALLHLTLHCEHPFMYFQVTFAYITLPDCKQSPSQRQLPSVAEHKKPLILIFSPVDESLEKWIHSPRQEDISGILWACQGCTERCVSKAIFVSLWPMVETGPHDPNRSLYHNKCPWTPCFWSTAYRVGFSWSIGNR